MLSERRSDNHSSAMMGRTIILLVLVTGFFIAVVFALPLILNTRIVRDKFLHEFEQRTGQRITTEQLDLRVFPRPGLGLRQAQVFDRSSEAPLFVADRLEMVLQIWSLLGGRIVVEYVVIERPRMTVRQDEAGRWTIGTSAPAASPSKTATPFMPFTVVRNVLITDGLVTIADESRHPQAAPLQLASLQVTIAEEIPGRTARVQLSGEVPQGGGSALFNIDGSLVMVHGPGSEGEPPASTQGIQVEGTVRIHRLDVRHIADWLGMPSLSGGFATSAQLVARVRLVPRPSGYDLIVAEWNVGLSDLSLQGTAGLTGLGTKISRLSATLSASSVPIKQTLNQLPAEWLPEEVRKRIAEHAVDGIVTLYDTHVEGTLGEESHLNVTGAMEIREGRFLPGATHPVIRDLSATVLYDLEQIRVTALRANYGPVRFSEGAILVTDWRREPLADVRISAEARAADLIPLLNDREKFSQIDVNVSQVEQVTGEIQVVAHAAGQLAKGSLGLVESSVTIRNLGFRHMAFAVPFRQIHASLNVSPTEIRLESLHGQVGPALVEAGGRVTLAGTPSFQDLTLKVTAEGEDIVSWLHPIGAEGPRPEGPILLSVVVTGDVGAPRFKGRLTLDGASMEISQVFTKAKGASAGFRFDGQLTEDRVVSVRRGELILPPLRLTGEGRIHLTDELSFRAEIVSDSLSLQKLPRGVTLGPIRAGILKAGLKMEGRAADRASWLASGRLQFEKGVMKVEQLEDPIRDVTMALRFDGKNIDIRRLSFNIGESDVHISGTITDWMEAPRAKLVAESSQIDVQSLMLTGQTRTASTETVPALSSWWSNGHVEATFLVDYVYYERFLLTGFSCRVRFEPGSLTIDRISGDTNEGHLGGRFVVYMSERGATSIRSAFRASGVPVERLSLLMEQQPRITGWMTAAGRVQAEFERGHLMGSSVNSRRPISIIIENGRIFNMPVLAKLLSIMNLPALLEGKINLTKEGMPLDRLKAVFSVEDGIIKIKEFLLDSPVLKISGTGRYDYISDQFDLVLVTSPLGQYSALLKSVPLFGKLFAGERQGFDTAIFEVKGPAKDPNVVYLPAESLMAGVKGTAQLAADLLVNAITLPKEAYSMAEDLFVDEEEPRGEGKSSEF
jgi:hypothetical protein